jgi:hypothetical protein
MHFLVKLALAAPANFFSAAAASQVAAAASLSHFFMKLFSAAPCSFFSVARAAQSGAAGGVCASATVEHAATAAKIVRATGHFNMSLSSKNARHYG